MRRSGQEKLGLMRRTADDASDGQPYHHGGYTIMIVGLGQPRSSWAVELS